MADLKADKFNPNNYTQTRKIGSLILTDNMLGMGTLPKVWLGYIDDPSCPVAVKIFSVEVFQDEERKKNI